MGGSKLKFYMREFLFTGFQLLNDSETTTGGLYQGSTVNAKNSMHFCSCSDLSK